MANDIKQVTNVNGGKFNLGDIEKAAIRGVEQGKIKLNYCMVEFKGKPAMKLLQ